MRPATPDEVLNMSTTTLDEGDFVGPIITRGDISDAAMEAAELDNPGREIRVQMGPAYIRLEARGEMLLTAANMSEVLGRPFSMGELERSMPGFSGFIRMGHDHVRFVASRATK
jgi:toluene monooxygenase system protein D